MTTAPAPGELTYHPLREAEPTDVPTPRNYLPERRGQGVYCKCDRPIAPGHIKDGPPTFDANVGRYVVTRRFFCHGCAAVFSWFEQCDADGHRTGIRLSRPVAYIDNATIDAFLSAYPDAAEVVEA